MYSSSSSRRHRAKDAIESMLAELRDAAKAEAKKADDHKKELEAATRKLKELEREQRCSGVVM